MVMPGVRPGMQITVGGTEREEKLIYAHDPIFRKTIFVPVVITQLTII